MLFGMILLPLNFEHMAERLVVGVFLWWERRSTRTVVLKNLTAHRIRNRKTTIMYALALGFIIFIMVSYRMELKTAELRTLKGAGATMYMDGPLTFQQLEEIEQTITAHEAEGHDTVVGTAWVTEPIKYPMKADETYLTTIGHIKSGEVNLRSVSPNFYDVALSADFLIAEEQKQDTGLSLSEQMYSARGAQSVLTSSGYRDTHQLRTLDERSTFLIVSEREPDPSVDREGQLNFTRMIPLAQLDSSPYFTMSRQNTEGFRNQDVVVSLDKYIELSAGAIGKTEDIKFDRLLIKLQPTATDDDIDDLVVTLIEATGLSPWDFRDFKNTLEKTDLVMTLIFSIATYIAMGLCLFSLMASMYTNIAEQAKEIGVLRAVGMQRGQIVRIFVYEAFTLVMAASLLGVMIGCVMAWTMQAQRILFTQLPVPMLFPYELLVVVVIGAVGCSIASSWGPARALVRRPTAQIMRALL
eukprot:TRINITY_DN54469_c0_g1_i1.p1 TRINITY_DN54469_c0_g1~~TRINITY_DN54469_c0_g1_i1.p1  ORF type:complete len:469 (+),score=244.49 TRINITY_DN54469_c0_g1_i1:3-1409(+)